MIQLNQEFRCEIWQHTQLCRPNISDCWNILFSYANSLGMATNYHHKTGSDDWVIYILHIISIGQFCQLYC